MGLPNPKNIGSSAAGDLGLDALLNPDLVLEAEERKKKELQASREKMGMTGESVYGNAASTLLGLAGTMPGAV